MPDADIPPFPSANFDKSDELKDYLQECPYSPGEFSVKALLLFLFVTVFSNMVAAVVYLLVEKPSMDAKRVYKNKFAK